MGRLPRGETACGETATEDGARREGTENGELGGLALEWERSSSTSRKMRSDFVPMLGRSRL